MVTTVQLFRDIAKENASIIRALRSITPQQAKTIAGAVQACCKAWDVQTIDDYDGYLSILVEPSASEDRLNTFFISGTAQRLELFQEVDDDITAIASFDDVESLSTRLTHLIRSAVSPS